MFVFLRGLFILEGGQDNYLFLFELRGRLQNELESRVGGREESRFVFDGRTVSSVEMEGDECFADGYAEFPVEHTGGLVGFEHKGIGGLGDWVIGGLGDWGIGGELGALGALGELGGSQGAAEPRQGRASRYGGALRGRTPRARPESGAKYGNQREEVTSCQVEEV